MIHSRIRNSESGPELSKEFEIPLNETFFQRFPDSVSKQTKPDKDLVLSRYSPSLKTKTSWETDNMEWTFSTLAELHAKFGWEEYVVLATTLLISAMIGIYFAVKGQNTTSEFLMASNQMTLFPTTMSLACR